MSKRSFTATKDHARLDVWLAAESGLSRSEIKKLLISQDITGPMERLKPAQEVRAGDEFTVIIKSKESKPQAENIPLEIAYEDEDLLVVNKKKGQVVHPAAGNKEGTLVNALLFYLEKNISDISGRERPGIVHRLDKDTSGLIVAAKNNKAHLNLALQFKERKVKRIYHAVAWGRFASSSISVAAPIGRDLVHRQRMAVRADGKDALTIIDLLEQAKYGAHIACELTSGRTHQIRVHLAYIGHPLVDDPVYGKKREKILGKGQILHAKSLEFSQPSTGELISLNSALPAEFNLVMEHLRGDG